MMAMWRPPTSFTSLSNSMSESASGSVVKRCGQKVKALVPILRFLMWGRWSGSLKGSRYCLSLRE